MTDFHDPSDTADLLDPAEVAEPDFAPWDGRRVPVTLLGGYLGAGKTTVLNQLLAETDRPIAVLVNDVGSVNIDADLIARHDGDTIELTDGCICCSLASGLVEAFDQLRDRPVPPEHVVIELSGVADPGRVIAWTGSAGFRLDGVIVLVDVDRFAELDADATLAPLVTEQYLRADLLVLSKLDLCTPEQEAHVRARLAEIVPDAPIVAAGSAATAGLIGLATRRGHDVTALPNPSLFDVHATATVALDIPIDLAAIDALLDALPDDVLRAKGIAMLPDGSRMLIQVVGKRREVVPLPAAEDQLPTNLVVITRR